MGNHNKPQTQHRRVQWTWCWMCVCEWVCVCVRDTVEGQSTQQTSPDTHLLDSRMKGLICQCCHYCDRQWVSYKNCSDSRTFDWIQTCSHFLLSCWYLCMTLIFLSLSRSIQPPSNSVQSDSLHKEPEDGAQISLDDQHTTAALPHMLPFCFPQTESDGCLLCLDLAWDYRHLNTQRTREK